MPVPEAIVRGAAPAALVVAGAVAVFPDGGFGQTSRGAFAALGGLALVLALVTAAGDRRPPRSLPIVALALLAGLMALSAVWTLVEPVRALRWALVIAGYAAAGAAAAIVCRERRGRSAVAAGLAGISVLAAAFGLAAFALRAEPMALHMAGEWQVAGPFEYPPALGVAALGAMPILLWGCLRGARALAAGCAGGLAIAAMTVALSSSRLVIALAAALVAATIAAPAPSLGGRRRVSFAWAIAAGAPVALLLVTDPADPASALDSDAARVGLLVLAAALASAMWHYVRPRLDVAPTRRLAIRSRLAAVAAVILCGTLGLSAAAIAERGGPGVERVSGWEHGRVAHWDAAGEAIDRRPWLGGGAESFYRASKRFQGRDAVLYAHNLPLELTVELGIAGALLALGLYGGVAMELWRRRRSAELWLFGAMAGGLLIVNLVDWSWHLAGIGALWAIALGALVAVPTGVRQPGT